MQIFSNSKQESYQCIPLNAFTSMFLLIVKEQIMDFID